MAAIVAGCQSGDRFAPSAVGERASSAPSIAPSVGETSAPSQNVAPPAQDVNPPTLGDPASASEDDAAAPTPNAAGSIADIAGTYYMIAGGGAGTLVINADGSYEYLGQAGGTVTMRGDKLDFSGTLASWHPATLKPDGTIEFSWSDSSGAKYWFVFERG